MTISGRRDPKTGAIRFTHDRETESFTDAFVAFIGGGENSRGKFPTNLSELNDDMKEFERIRRAPDTGGHGQ